MVDYYITLVWKLKYEAALMVYKFSNFTFMFHYFIMILFLMQLHHSNITPYNYNPCTRIKQLFSSMNPNLFGRKPRIGIHECSVKPGNPFFLTSFPFIPAYKTNTNSQSDNRFSSLLTNREAYAIPPLCYLKEK